MRLARLALWGLWSALLLPTAVGAEVLVSSPGLSAAGDSLPTPPLPNVHHIGTIPEFPNDGTSTMLVLDGSFPYPCGEIFDAQVNAPNHVSLSMREVDVCPTFPNWRHGFPLGLLPEGPHTVEIELKVFGDPSGEPKIHVGHFTFMVGPSDSTLPRPELPYVNAVNILPKNLEPPLCARDSILLRISGLFPVGCFELKEVEILFPEITVLGPPTVRLIIGKPPCPIDGCPTVIVPFSVAVTLPPLPAAGYALPVQVEEVICTTRGPEVVVHSELFPFRVLDCTPPDGCLLGSFLRTNANDRCDAAVGPDRPAQLTYAIETPVALAGLQGSFGLYPRGLTITDLEPIGPAQGMNLSWSNNPDGGASFVLFAEQGAPIPPVYKRLDRRVPVLRITVESSASQNVPPITTVTADAFGADADGNGVPHCPTFAPISANICIVRQCDHNRDGHIDVRDLVLMVRCLYEDGPCPDLAVLDCTLNGEFDLDDVICCAFRILRRDNCPDCPPDTTRARREPGVRYAIGKPLRLPLGVSAPITIEGVGRLGGARLALGFPDDRYQVESVELQGNPANWLDLHEVQGGQVVVGLIRTGPNPLSEIAEAPLEVMLNLTLKPGQQPGGQLSTLESEFSGPDGVPLEIDLAQTTRRLALPIGLALSRNQPDPFTTQTVFSVSLTAAADVSVVIYDVSGRLVRSLHRGLLEAGSHELRWNGTRADGSRVRRGIYFYRAVAGEQSVARKMILLEGN